MTVIFVKMEENWFVVIFVPKYFIVHVTSRRYRLSLLEFGSKSVELYGNANLARNTASHRNSFFLLTDAVNVTPVSEIE